VNDPPAFPHVADRTHQEDAALVEKVRSLLSSGLSWQTVAKETGIPESRAAKWLRQHPDAIPPTLACGQTLELPDGRVLVYLEGRRRYLTRGTQRVLAFLLTHPGVGLSELVSRLQLRGTAPGYAALQAVNRQLRTLDPPLAKPFRFRVRRGRVEVAGLPPSAPADSTTPPPAALPLRDAIGKFLAHLAARGCAANTVKSYGYDLARYEAWTWRAAGLADPLAPTLGQLEAFIRHQQECGLAASTTNRCVACLRVFSRWLVSQGLPATMGNAELLGAAKVEQRVAGTLTAEQMAKLLAEPKPDDRFYQRDRCLLELLCSLGGRASELADLRLEDVDVSQSRCVLSGKGRKRRVAFLTPRALDALKAYVAGQRTILAARNRYCETPWLLLSRNGRRLSREAVFLIVQRYVWRAGLPKNAAHPHAIRHSFATALLGNGASIVNVRDLLGHETVATTQRYTHPTPEDLLAAHARFHPLGDPTIPTQDKE
jgi:integrase/recombinase XerD